MFRIVFFCFVFFGISLQAQSVPEPLSKAKKSIQQCPSYKVVFLFQLEYPEQNKIIQKGNFLQSKDDFKLSIDSKTWLKNDDILYFIDAEAEEVNINSIEPEDDVLTPYSFLQKLDSEHYEFYVLDGTKGSEIFDLKPLDKVEYFKIRVSFQAGKISSVRVFNSDGSRFQFDIRSSDCLDEKSPKGLQYNPADYSNYFVEDLRID